MKRHLMIVLAVLCCLLCLAALSVYALPRGMQTVDWSLMTEGDQKSKEENWTVYVVRENRKVLLEGNNGRYAGCNPGETFYYARIWDAQIAQPILRIHAVMASVAVWLDDDLVYTDMPLPENLEDRFVLPMLTTDRAGAVEIPLYGEVYGHTLTIAQASPLESETGYAYVYPCDVEVNCTYGYERGLIAQANRTGLMELTLCGIAVLLCYLSCKHGESAFLLLALLACLRLLGVIAGTDFFYQYTALWGMDFGVFASRLSFSVMLGFLTFKCDRARSLMGAMAALHGLSAIAALIIQAIGLTNNTFVFISFLPDRLTLVFWVSAVALAAVQAHRHSPVCFAWICAQRTVCSCLPVKTPCPRCKPLQSIRTQVSTAMACALSNEY
ncbi:MAG: hypothetical protein PHI98_12765 [Eubacteriales bacterium]|nr:hypothetical protein [Eubacteriales bacterium]